MRGVMEPISTYTTAFLILSIISHCSPRFIELIIEYLGVVHRSRMVPLQGRHIQLPEIESLVLNIELII